jgi:hypothetical protein
MNTQFFYHLALVAHISGLTIMAGATVVDALITRQFWKSYFEDKSRALGINQAMSKIPLLFGIGILLLILSGVAMMGMTGGAFGEQLWFRIKFGLVILIILNGLAVGRRLGTKLKKLLAAEIKTGSPAAALLPIREKLNVFHAAQLTLFLLIFILSVFKFN